jgi:deoxyribonuclease-4
MSIAGGHDRAVRAAREIGFDTVQLFTKSNNQWTARPLTDDQIQAFRAALSETGVVSPIGHTSYLINLASPDDALWRKSIHALTVEVERAEALGLTDLVHHPGAHVGSGEKAGLTRITEALDEVDQRTVGMSVRLDLESTAGQGSCLGHRLEHLAEILKRVRHPDRLGICLDTCHLFAAGYSFGNPLEYNNLISEVERILGLDRIRVWHLNDSVKERGSRVDRHAGIGRGLLGLDAFRNVLNDPRFAGCPMILETPKGTEQGEDLDRINLRILRDLLTTGPTSA